MKSTQGLLVALVLGILAAVLNWFYLASHSRGVELIEFIGVRPGATILHGERLSEEKLEPVPIPAAHVGSLDGFAIRYRDLQTVLTKPVARTLVGGSLLLEDDLRTPPAELALKKPQAGGKEEEVAIFVPVSMSAFVPSLVKPGDRVSFFAGSGGPSTPTPAGTPTGPAAGRRDLIGPFVVLALGSRLSSEDVAKASTAPASQQNILTIRGRLVDGQFDELTERLRREIGRAGARGMDVCLHARD